jgi:hypothetical protein
MSPLDLVLVRNLVAIVCNWENLELVLVVVVVVTGAYSQRDECQEAESTGRHYSGQMSFSLSLELLASQGRVAVLEFVNVKTEQWRWRVVDHMMAKRAMLHLQQWLKMLIVLNAQALGEAGKELESQMQLLRDFYSHLSW